jgi:hypothetical protein
VFTADTGTGTPLRTTHRTPVQWVNILRGIGQGTPTACRPHSRGRCLRV